MLIIYSETIILWVIILYYRINIFAAFKYYKNYFIEFWDRYLDLKYFLKLLKDLKLRSKDYKYINNNYINYLFTINIIFENNNIV